MLTGDVPDPVYALPGGDGWVIAPDQSTTVHVQALLDRFPARDESSALVTWALGGDHVGDVYRTSFAPLHGNPSYPGHTVLEGVVSDLHFGPTDVRPFLTRCPLDSFERGGVFVGNAPATP